MKFHIITIFPDQLEQSLKYGVIGKAIERSIIEINLIDPRKFSDNDYGSIDDKPYGGGPGMVMQCDPLLSSIEKAKEQTEKDTLTVFLTPQGEQFTQRHVQKFSKHKDIIIVSARYEGLDERIIQLTDNSMELSIGDYVLSGGEIPSAIIVDSVSRLIPGVLGDAESANNDSFSSGLLEHPHYTRPENVRGETVPKVLLSGDHQAIEEWRMKKSLIKTFKKRPDLLDSIELSEDQKTLLNDYKKELKE